MTPPNGSPQPAHHAMEFIEILWGSASYHDATGLRERMLREPLGMKFPPETFQSERHQWHFGLRSLNELGIPAELVACITAVPLSETNAKLRQMCVATGWQNRGLGRQLLERAEQTLAQRGFQSVELHARVVVKGFYQRCGYQGEGAEFTEVGIPHVKMTKRLE